MRLTHLKLAGFKSFADPTTLHIHGQRVGVVGPNGCGKSNVMESIRWVLGESSAKEMRGDSMSDVIFNGSGNRKPVSRASVELLFDNSLGGASGEWSQYAEISVKRVLQRDSGSTYYINNTQVRRRDVADLFLGTGLGGRAYAIIGQNTISRIVEARPEDLRVFLEEAAGISKYKERRRETELRLRDTRDNLTRVEDIRRELAGQIERLEAQALVAQQYHALQEQLAQTGAQVWLMKKRDAAQAWEKSRRQVERLVNDLEAQTAALRKSESLLEQLRLQYQEGSTLVQAAQGRYYEANARVSALEQQIRHAQQTRERIAQQLSQLLAELQKTEMQKAETVAQLAQQREALGHATEASQQAQQALESARRALPGAEQAARDGQAAFSQLQNAIVQAEQAIQLERTHAEHAGKSLEALRLRQQRLTEDMGRLAVPDSGVLTAKQEEHAMLQQRLTVLEAELQHMADAEHRQAETLRTRQRELQEEQHRLAQYEAQRAALSKLQAALGHESKLEAWLQQHRIADARRLWQCLVVEPGCEAALEGLLGSRLNAVIADIAQPAQRPPAALVIAQTGGEATPSARHGQGWRPLRAVVAHHEAALEGLLQEWLGQAWLLEEATDPVAARRHLAPGEVLVTRDGDVHTRHSVSFHAAQSGLHGVLERQRELMQLEDSLPALREALRAQHAGLQEAELQLHEVRKQIASQQQVLRQETARAHALGLDLQRVQQQLQHALERRRHLEEEQGHLAGQKHDLEARLHQHEVRIESLLAGLAEQRAQREQAAQIRQACEQALRVARERLQDAERQAQQQEFSHKIISSKISELESRLNILDENILSLSGHHEEFALQLSTADDATLKPAMAEALELQRQEEQALLQTREQFAALEQSLQEGERHRMQSEQLLHPMRDRLEQARLAEQQARLHFEQCVDALNQSGYDEAELTQQLARGARTSELERHAEDLARQIAELGAVNLAAIQELASERERKTYLDSQSSDLEQAVATLEEAIRRIDRETRARLQQTYEEANRHFGELFMTLFGGGQAQLQLLGDEILDTGVQVFAQPPGKKNSTIHLLSGGEKALTALALVFALFRLNPAPFCLLDEVDAPLDDSNTERFCTLVRKMSERTQFLFVSHNKITMEMAQQLVGVTMQESGVSRIVEVDIEAAMQMQTELAL